MFVLSSSRSIKVQDKRLLHKFAAIVLIFEAATACGRVVIIVTRVVADNIREVAQLKIFPLVHLLTAVLHPQSKCLTSSTPTRWSSSAVQLPSCPSSLCITDSSSKRASPLRPRPHLRPRHHFQGHLVCSLFRWLWRKWRNGAGDGENREGGRPSA
jgi:hypothetical protein